MGTLDSKKAVPGVANGRKRYIFLTTDVALNFEDE